MRNGVYAASARIDLHQEIKDNRSVKRIPRQENYLVRTYLERWTGSKTSTTHSRLFFSSLVDDHFL